jgi:hypothetical protein
VDLGIQTNVYMKMPIEDMYRAPPMIQDQVPNWFPDVEFEEIDGDLWAPQGNGNTVRGADRCRLTVRWLL